jgi:peptidoglycan/LPS O-acetylase OafA/YrhL
MRWLQYNPAPRLFDFLAGCAIARLNVRPHLGPTRAWTGVAYASGALFLVALFGSPFVNSYPDGPRIESFGYDFAYLLPLSLMMLALARSPHCLLARSLSTPTMLLLGAASYALYLCHQFVIQGIVAENATGVLPPIALGTPTGLVRAVMVVGLVTVLSIGLYRTIEEPMRRLLRARFDAATGGPGVVVRRPPSDPVIDRGPAPAPEVGSKV